MRFSSLIHYVVIVYISSMWGKKEILIILCGKKKLTKD